MDRRLLFLAVVAGVLAPSAIGQTNLFQGCLSGGPIAHDLVCQFPFSTGILNEAFAGTFTTPTNQTNLTSATVLATTFNSAIATQVSQLPVSTATAGTVLLYENGAYTTYHNQGPILTDRPQTVGKNHLFLGFTASEYVFTSIDGQSLKDLPAEFTGNSTSGAVYVKDQSSLAFRLTQYVGTVTYGLTDRLDLSAILPIERVSLGASQSNVYAWTSSSTSPGIPGEASSTRFPYTSGSSSGVGDVTVNLKYLLWNGTAGSGSRGGRSAISVGLNAREPFGDDLNLLGSGAFGFQPYLSASYLAAVSPHVKFGYQWNSSTELNPSITANTSFSPTNGQLEQTFTTGPNKALPGGLVYSIGADWAANKHLTVAVDDLGSQYLNATVLTVAQAIATISNTTPSGSIPTGCTVSPITGSTNSEALSCPAATSGVSSYTINQLSTGVKLNPVGNLVISANVLTQLDDNGLRSRPVPLLGIAYKF